MVTATPSSTTTLRIDPGSPGAYGVGVTDVTFVRPSGTGSSRPLKTFVWYPTDSAESQAPMADAAPSFHGAPFPLVMLSHAEAADAQATTYLAVHLATWGFVVAAPQHPDNVTQERADDIDFVTGQIQKPRAGVPLLNGMLIDAKRAAVIGVSTGAATALTAAQRGRFGAVLTLASYPAVLADAPRMHLPVMIMFAGRDALVPDKGTMTALFERLPSDTPHYLLFFPDGVHNSYIDRCFDACSQVFDQQRGHDLIARYATAFLETHIVRDERYARDIHESAGEDGEEAEVDDPPDVELTHLGP